MIIDTRDFGGLFPRIDKRMLPANSAQIARNVKLWTGVLSALKAPKLVVTLSKTGTIQSIYRLPYDGNDYWLHWATDVDAVRGPVAFDERVYYTGDGEPRVTSAEMASQKTDTVDGTDNYPGGYGESVSTDYPRAFYTLGVPRPNVAPTLGTPSGGSGTDEARAYVYTFVTEWGEESAPSVPSAIKTGKPDGTWPLTGMDVAPLNTGVINDATHSGGYVTVTTTAAHWLQAGHKITVAAVVGMTDLNATWTVYDVPSTTTFRVALTTAQSYTSGGTWTRKAPYNVTGMVKRIYRVLTGFDGQDYKYVAEIAVATTTYNDTKVAADLGETLETQDPRIAGSAWDMPPGDLTGIVSLGKFFVGFRGNEVCFSEPDVPYAWPTRYRQKTDWPIVGLGVWGSTLVILTSAVPYRATGFHPEAIAFSRGDQVYPCVSKRSIVSGSGFGVVFATDRGLAADASVGTVLITDQFYDRDTWDDAVDSDAMMAMEYDGRYYGFWPIDATVGGAISFDPTERRGAITTSDFIVNGVWFDPETGIAYVVDSEGVKRWDADLAERQTYEWKGKQHVLPMPTTLKAAKVIADFTIDADEVAAIEAANAIIEAANAALIAAIPLGVVEDGSLYGEVGGDAVGMHAVGGDLLQSAQSVEFDQLQFEIYGDGVLVYSVALSDNKPFRIPGGLAYDRVEKRLAGNVTVHSVQVADTMSELARL